MLFHSFQFLVFFSIVFTVYWLLRDHRQRLMWLLGTSCYFYMSWNPWLILLILLSAAVDYLVALRLDRVDSQPVRRLLLIGSISANLGLLLYFKYTNFLLDAVTPAINLLGVKFQPPLVHLILPLGISFYTFETISYIVDVYHRRRPSVKNLVDYALYIMFFPHLVAGPIVRPHDFLPQLATQKQWSWLRIQVGLQQFLVGLFKKAVIADTLAPVVDQVFLNPGGYESSAIWLAVLCYAVQIYCDFSGYSDMAVGLAHTLGFSLPANFRMPYLASSITEFWGRWHITLSTWLRDYLYIPLGGNRGGTLYTYRNLMLTMLLGGLWHGAEWTFLIWGLYHGILLIVDRAFPRRGWFATPASKPLWTALTFLCVCIGWVFFRAHRLQDAGTILTRMLIPTGGTSLTYASCVVVTLCLLVVLAGHLIAEWADIKKLLRALPRPVLGALLGLSLFAIQLLIPEGSKAFIYFQF